MAFGRMLFPGTEFSGRRRRTRHDLAVMVAVRTDPGWAGCTGSTATAYPVGHSEHPFSRKHVVAGRGLTIGIAWLMSAVAGADRCAPLPVLRRKRLAGRVGLLSDDELHNVAGGDGDQLGQPQNLPQSTSLHAFRIASD